MLSIMSDDRRRDCDGVSRRELLRIGGLGLTGLLSPQLLSAAGGGVESYLRDKAVVLLFLGGGPSHIETFNPNMQAPSPYRSMTGEVSTTIPGVTFGGDFPLLARHADKMAIVRSFHHTDSNHSRAVPYVLSGGGTFSGGMGAVYARLRGTNHPGTGMPSTAIVTAPDVGRFQNPRKRIIAGSQPGDLGAAYVPFNPDGDGPVRDNLKLNIPADRLDDRRLLLTALDGLKRQAAAGGSLAGVGDLQRQAFDVILGAAAEAFDLSQESPRTLADYDTSMFRVGEKPQDMRNCSLGKQLLLTRRLVEAGCGFVTVQNSGWDMHGGSGNNYMSLPAGMKMLGGPVDKAVSAFLEDLSQRGLLDKVLLVITGEFGRTPRINKNAGRDHWANLSTLALAGGGLKMGQVIGQATRKNDVPLTEPIRVENLMATLMHTLFDVGQLRVARGVPRNLLGPIENHQPIGELF